MNQFYYPLPQRSEEEPSTSNYNCEKCGILGKRTLKHPKMTPLVGNQYDGFVIVPTNPTHEEDEKGNLLVSYMGTILRSIAFKRGFNLVHRAAILPLIRCSVGKPTEVQARCCFKEFEDQLIALKPKVIIPLGDLPFKYIMHSQNKASNTLIRNRIIPNYFYNAVVFPLWNINEIRGANTQMHLQKACDLDFKRILSLYINRFKSRKKVDEFLKSRKILEDISIRQLKTIKEFDQTIDLLSTIPQFAFDYETTNVYPYDDDFEIVTIAFGLEKSAWVVHESMWNQNTSIRMHIYDRVKSLLVNPNIKKIIQNSKFEDLASRFVLGIKWIENMECTMLASHVIDERPGATNLDFQNLVRFGIPPYNEKVKSLLEAKDGNRTNSIREIPPEDLVEYTGLDVITTFNNWKLIESSLFKSYPMAKSNYEFLRKGHWTYANIQQRGIALSETRYYELIKMLDDESTATMNQIQALPEFIEFNEYMKTKLAKKKGDQKESLKILGEKIHERLRPIRPPTVGAATPNLAGISNPNDGIGISESLRDRIAAIRRKITFQ